jgi:hypothetical protein
MAGKANGGNRPEADYLPRPRDDRWREPSRPLAADSTSTTLTVDGLMSLGLARDPSGGIPITRTDDQTSLAGCRTAR